MLSRPNAGDSIIVRLKIGGQTKGFSQVTARIAELNGHIGAIDLVRPLSQVASIRDISIYTSGADHGEEIVEALKKVEGVKVIHYSDCTFLLHLDRKIEVTSRKTLKTRDDLNEAKQWFAQNTNPEGRKGSLSEVIAGADMFLGVSGPRQLSC